MWHPVPFSEGDGWLKFKVTLPAQEKEIIAGQEIIDNVHYIEWLSSLIKEPEHSKVISLGVSSEGRNLAALEHTVPSSDKWLILIGRQHPPEVTGAIAFSILVSCYLVMKNTFLTFVSNTTFYSSLI